MLSSALRIEKGNGDFWKDGKERGRAVPDIEIDVKALSG
jgi:hypothetical protein